MCQTNLESPFYAEIPVQYSGGLRRRRVCPMHNAEVFGLSRYPGPGQQVAKIPESSLSRPHPIGSNRSERANLWTTNTPSTWRRRSIERLTRKATLKSCF